MRQCCRIKTSTAVIKLRGRRTPPPLVCIADSELLDGGTVLGVMPVLEKTYLLLLLELEPSFLKVTNFFL